MEKIETLIDKVQVLPPFNLLNLTRQELLIQIYSVIRFGYHMNLLGVVPSAFIITDLLFELADEIVVQAQWQQKLEREGFDITFIFIILLFIIKLF
jgi:hypothetical protein